MKARAADDRTAAGLAAAVGPTTAFGGFAPPGGASNAVRRQAAGTGIVQRKAL